MKGFCPIASARASVYQDVKQIVSNRRRTRVMSVKRVITEGGQDLKGINWGGENPSNEREKSE
jgi:hypothetical protein